jgi:tetraacyldisaccharide 4'-kinase
MFFDSFWMKIIRIIVFPIALLYGGIIALRNMLYNKGIMKTFTFDIPIINIGNLSTGGTGKSPMVDYLMELLPLTYKTAILSRGYKRKTKGYVLATEESTAKDIGDEPMQFYQKFPHVAVAVGEERILAVPNLLYDKPETQVIVLDDAFQHRAISAGLNVLLTDYNNRYTKDYFLPTGNLRDSISSATRAQIIVVTKCPITLTPEAANALEAELKILPSQTLFFTSLQYHTPYHWLSKQPSALSKGMSVLLVTGIANPTGLIDFVTQQVNHCESICFPDHHQFTTADIHQIQSRFNKMPWQEKIILTTEKDRVRFLQHTTTLNDLPMLVQPIGITFLFNRKQDFNNLMINFITHFS